MKKAALFGQPHPLNKPMKRDKPLKTNLNEFYMPVIRISVLRFT